MKGPSSIVAKLLSRRGQTKLEEGDEPVGGVPVELVGSDEPVGGVPVELVGSDEPVGGVPVELVGSDEPVGGGPDRSVVLDRSVGSDNPAGLNLWYEVALIVLVYVGYSAVRNLFGSARVSPATAATNADLVISVERSIGLYFEPSLQKAFIGYESFLQFWNLFYGLLHFLATGLVLVWLYWRRAAHFRFWRCAGLAATVFAVAGYAIFPLMPPRLLDDCGRFGACRSDSGYVDTVIEVGGLWSFDSSPIQALSNQYAAMPSLHVGWAIWVAVVVVRLGSSRISRVTAVMYPVLTLFAVVVTANHYWLDGLGGAVVVAAGVVWSRYWVGRSS